MFCACSDNSEKVICRIGSLENIHNFIFSLKTVICRIGSLENFAFLPQVSVDVICRIGSLEIEYV